MAMAEGTSTVKPVEARRAVVATTSATMAMASDR